MFLKSVARFKICLCFFPLKVEPEPPLNFDPAPLFKKSSPTGSGSATLVLMSWYSPFNAFVFSVRAGEGIHPRTRQMTRTRRPCQRRRRTDQYCLTHPFSYFLLPIREYFTTLFSYIKNRKIENNLFSFLQSTNWVALVRDPALFRRFHHVCDTAE